MTQTIAFTKMHALGNDFIVIDGITQRVSLSAEDIVCMGDRHKGIGCDQVLLLEQGPSTEKSSFNYRIFNANGQEVGQCGNGARCAAHFIQDKGWLTKDKVTLFSFGRKMEVSCLPAQRFAVNMGLVDFAPDKIPLMVKEQEVSYLLKIGQLTCSFVALSLGNPHAVFFNQSKIQTICRELKKNKFFSQGVNVGFAQIISRNQLKLRVIERGVGETYACGSGACAAVIAGSVLGLLNKEVNVQLKGGELTVKYFNSAQPVWLIGPSSKIYEGVYKIS